MVFFREVLPLDLAGAHTLEDDGARVADHLGLRALEERRGHALGAERDDAVEMQVFDRTSELGCIAVTDEKCGSLETELPTNAPVGKDRHGVFDVRELIRALDVSSRHDEIVELGVVFRRLARPHPEVLVAEFVIDLVVVRIRRAEGAHPGEHVLHRLHVLRVLAGAREKRALLFTERGSVRTIDLKTRVFQGILLASGYAGGSVLAKRKGAVKAYAFFL